MKRRMLSSTAIALVVAAPAPSQPSTRKPRIGYLGGSHDPATLRSTVEPFRQGLRELGWTEGQDLAPIEFRWAEGKDERYPALLDELLRLDLDLLVTVGLRAALVAKEATRTLPKPSRLVRTERSRTPPRSSKKCAADKRKELER